MVSNKNELDKFIERKLSLIEPTKARNPEKAAFGREVYMNQAKSLRGQKAHQPVSNTFKGIFGLRPRIASTALAAILALAILFGGAWGTVYAAQDSLPGDFLYSVKLFDENIRLTFAGSTESRIELLKQYSDRRVDEAINMAVTGEPIPESLPTDAAAQIDEMFVLVAALDDVAMEQALSGVQIHLRDQDRIMGQTMGGLPEGVDPQLLRLQAMFQARQQRAASGLEAPNEYRNQFRNQANKPTVTATDWVTPTNSLTITPTATITVTATPVLTDTWPYGPGPCEDHGNCLPQGDGPGPGPFDGTPTPPQDQQGYGPGSDEGNTWQVTITPKVPKSSDGKSPNKGKP